MVRSRTGCLLGGLGVVLALLSGCAGAEKERVATIASLELDRVVLYRNGVGYFERSGEVDGDLLTLKIRKDQVNDVLKSLTVVDRSTGHALSVSMPLDPQSWANAALATLSPGEGSLSGVLDALRGTWVSVNTESGTRTIKGRILMVEYHEDIGGEGEAVEDHRLTLIDGGEVMIVLVSEIDSIVFQDEELSLQLHRALDASAGEGMFQQVEVDVRLSGDQEHDLLLSYVVSAPIWKPTYRVVLPEEPNGEALLQGWAVVDNTSGEDWDSVLMSLTSGAPIAFRYNMHTPLNIHRPDMTSAGQRRQARVSMGETTLGAERDDRAAEAKAREPSRDKAPSLRSRRGANHGYGRGGGGLAELEEQFDDLEGDGDAPEPAEDSGILMDELRSSTRASARARRVSGLTRFDLEDRVTVPDGSATMVSVINEIVEAEQAFLFRPGGSGPGYEFNPYRVVRFKNKTPYALEPGPISIYAGGSFVGEGISELIAADTSATIPFAVEPEITVTSKIDADNTEARLVRIGRGHLRIESFQRRTTTWTVKAPKKDQPYKVLVRQSRLGGNYTLKDRPEGTEDLPDAYLIPIQVPAGIMEASIQVIEQTPVERSISVWDAGAPQVLESVLALSGLDAASRKKIEPIINRRKEIADIDRRTENLKKQQVELDQRARQTRANLLAIEKDKNAAALRKRLTARLEEFTREGDKLGREIVELTSKRLEKKIELDEALDGFTFETPTQKEGAKE